MNEIILKTAYLDLDMRYGKMHGKIYDKDSLGELLQYNE